MYRPQSGSLVAAGAVLYVLPSAVLGLDGRAVQTTHASNAHKMQARAAPTKVPSARIHLLGNLNILGRLSKLVYATYL